VCFSVCVLLLFLVTKDVLFWERQHLLTVARERFTDRRSRRERDGKGRRNLPMRCIKSRSVLCKSKGRKEGMSSDV